MNITPSQLERISDLVGAKYTEYGRSIEDGFDCFTLTRHVLAILGVEMPDLPAYTKDGADAVALLDYQRHFTKCHEHPGAIVALAPLGADEDQHIGVVLPGGMFIHVRRGTSCVVERLALARPFIRGFYRLRGAE